MAEFLANLPLTMLERSSMLSHMNKLSVEERVRIVACLVEGKLENHEHALALYFMYYNFAPIHQTLRVTPAMEAGVADHVWSLEEIIGLSK